MRRLRFPHTCPNLVLLFLISIFFSAIPAQAQDNYEIQVYGADTVAPGDTMVEMHSNFTLKGIKAAPGSNLTVDGTYPTDHAEHETLEITHGFTPWSEVGFYVFTSAREGQGWQWVGDHIRPRVRAPASWHWPVGASLSFEVGYQRRLFSPDTWTVEFRPIVDKQVGKWYLAFNPALERSLQGPGVSQGIGFSPNVKVSYEFTKKITAGLEYYAAYGELGNFDSFHNQQQQFFPSIDLNLDPKWEVNLGVGLCPTSGTDRLIIKAIVGRHFEFHRHTRG